MNGDLLTKVNFNHLLEFHSDHGAQATMCVREFDFQVPYGVANVDHQKLLSIEEKPVHKFFVNAGIYVLEPETLNLIPPNEYFDMTSVFEKLTESNLETVAFPIREYWIDLGRMEDFQKAQGEYNMVFE